ncbi:hypothetical protein [Nocardia noduli]|uniref:hypothetical protein n=1 Tax=Nocardia noduli TaxID=2815722 RepID=UPI001C244EA6|nr:hypothetical protein [Nocardia noduli]
MRPGLEQARDKQFGAFAVWQVLCEYTRGEMRVLVDRGEWVRVFRGVYREADTPPVPELRVEAARLTTGLTSVIAAYDTAAQLHGFAVADTRTTHVLGARPARSAQLFVHRDHAEAAELELIRGTLTTTAARTAVDVARTASRDVAAATLEVVVEQGISPVRLVREVSRHRGRRGYRQAVELIGRLDAGPVVACHGELPATERGHAKSGASPTTDLDPRSAEPIPAARLFCDEARVVPQLVCCATPPAVSRIGGDRGNR